MDERDDKTADTTQEVDTAREEVAQTEPAKAPLPDPEGLAHTLSPVDLPEPAQPLPDGLRWTMTVIAIAALVLVLFNAGSLRSWADALKPTPVNDRIVVAADAWYDVTATIGLNRPADALRAGWEKVQQARFGGAQNEAGPDAGATEPAP